MEFGKHQITVGSKIGHGSYGNVHQCVIEERRYAVKIIPKNYALEILMELVVLCSIRHPSLLNASFRPRFVNKRDLYVVTPLAISDLRKYTNKHSGLIARPETLKLWSSQLCQAVYVLHFYGLVHGDIKASNVMVMGDSRVVLGDFTSTILLKNERRFNFYSTTVTHRSLEEFMGKIIPAKYFWTGKPQDIWALACTLYEMCYGQPIVEFTGVDNYDDGSSEATVMKSVKQLLALLAKDPDATTSPMYADAKIYTSECAYVAVQRPPERFLGPFGAMLASMLCLDPEKRVTARGLIQQTEFHGSMEVERGNLMKVKHETSIDDWQWVHTIPATLDRDFVNGIYAKIPHTIVLPVAQKQRIALLISALMTRTVIHDLSVVEIKYVLKTLDAIGMRLL